MLKVVIDTNVFISAFYLTESKPAKVVLLARRGKIFNSISSEILKEIERVLKEKLLWDQSKTKNTIGQIKNFSKVVRPQERLAVIADDPDNRLLECALETQADFIISGDKHLLNLNIFHGTRIVTPAEFLESWQ